MPGSTLTNLIPDAYAALDVVSRELTGLIASVTRDSTADRVAAGQTLRSIVAPVNSAGADITPAMSIPADASQTIGNKSLTISNNRFFPFSWTNQQRFARRSTRSKRASQSPRKTARLVHSVQPLGQLLRSAISRASKRSSTTTVLLNRIAASCSTRLLACLSGPPRASTKSTKQATKHYSVKVFSAHSTASTSASLDRSRPRPKAR